MKWTASDSEIWTGYPLFQKLFHFLVLGMLLEIVPNVYWVSGTYQPGNIIRNIWVSVYLLSKKNSLTLEIITEKQETVNVVKSNGWPQFFNSKYKLFSIFVCVRFLKNRNDQNYSTAARKEECTNKSLKGVLDTKKNLQTCIIHRGGTIFTVLVHSLYQFT